MTQWSEILTDAANRSLMNDAATPLIQDTAELLRVGGRLLRKLYLKAGLPRPQGFQRGNYFVLTTTLTVGTPNTALVALPSSPEAAHILQIVDNAGTRVAVVSLADLRNEQAEIPPAVVVQNNRIRSAARPGDPAAGAVLTVDYSYLPPMPTSIDHYVGSTTLTDASTSAWPTTPGDQWLIDSLATYLATKDEREPSAEVKESLAEATQLLGDLLGTNLASLQLVEDV